MPIIQFTDKFLIKIKKNVELPRIPRLILNNFSLPFISLFVLSLSERHVGIEPTTPDLEGRCSTVELMSHIAEVGGIELPQVLPWSWFSKPAHCHSVKLPYFAESRGPDPRPGGSLPEPSFQD